MLGARTGGILHAGPRTTRASSPTLQLRWAGSDSKATHRHKYVCQASGEKQGLQTEPWTGSQQELQVSAGGLI